MSKYFSQLSLHACSDIHPRSWICVKGDNIGPIIKKLENSILKTEALTRRSLSAKIASTLRCSHNTIEQLFRREKGFYPIPFILELAKRSRWKNGLLKKIDRSTRCVKVNSASAKPVKVIRSLNGNLAKILGAFMADGSLSVQVVIASTSRRLLKTAGTLLKNAKIRHTFGRAPSRKQHYISMCLNGENFQYIMGLPRILSLPVQTHYTIELTDEYKDSVEAFNRWMSAEFSIAPLSFRINKNSWRATYSNKIVARYFMQFFDVTPGPKTYTAHEPPIIQKSSLAIRKSFARGVLMFDGCVTKRRKLVFTTVSKNLCSSIQDIWGRDKIKFGLSVSRGDEINLFTTSGNPEKKLLSYLEEGTQKWKLLNWLSGNIRYTPIIHAANSLSVEKVLDMLGKVKNCDAFFLKKRFSCSHTTIRGLLKILRDQGKIKLSRWPHGIYKDGVAKSATVFLAALTHSRIFRKIKEQFGRYQNCAAFLGVPKATLSAWKVRKNRISLEALEKLCDVLDLSYDKVLRNVREIDREIAEII